MYVQMHALKSEKVHIGIDISDTGFIFTWYRIVIKFCSMAHPYHPYIPSMLLSPA